MKKNKFKYWLIKRKQKLTLLEKIRHEAFEYSLHGKPYSEVAAANRLRAKGEITREEHRAFMITQKNK